MFSEEQLLSLRDPHALSREFRNFIFLCIPEFLTSQNAGEEQNTSSSLQFFALSRKSWKEPPGLMTLDVRVRKQRRMLEWQIEVACWMGRG